SLDGDSPYGIELLQSGLQTNPIFPDRRRNEEPVLAVTNPLGSRAGRFAAISGDNPARQCCSRGNPSSTGVPWKRDIVVSQLSWLVVGRMGPRKTPGRHQQLLHERKVCQPCGRSWPVSPVSSPASCLVP